ncbi:MAG: hypothetical protein KJO07_11625 [Deltaproteobacteria bacterium]|nr:hypothetical protein [Deltaproteobacteria bacterium]
MTTRLFLVCVAALTSAACGDDQSKQGFRDPCSEAAGAIDGCEYQSLATPEDLCWRLVECGVIPVEDPDDDDVFDWGDCANSFENLANYRFEHSAACVANSSCDELILDGSPNGPFGGILCRRHGDQD